MHNNHAVKMGILCVCVLVREGSGSREQHKQ